MLTLALLVQFMWTFHPLGYHTPFHIQGDDFETNCH